MQRSALGLILIFALSACTTSSHVEEIDSPNTKYHFLCQNNTGKSLVETKFIDTPNKNEIEFNLYQNGFRVNQCQEISVSEYVTLMLDSLD
jgi:hypothetical protein|tara:strand:- start:619 stop:891 length:273 start_codon:yes stop_codon:yes gene_type:complete